MVLLLIFSSHSSQVMALPCLRAGSSQNALQQFSRVNALCASFSTSSLAMAAPKKSTAKKVVAKKKTSIRKTSAASGPRSTISRSKGGGDYGSGVSRDNPFLGAQIKMPYLQEFLPEAATQDNLHQAMAWTRRTLDATRIEGFGLTREIARQHSLLPRPRSVLRQASLDLFEILDKSSASSTSSSNTLLRGSTGAGTSTLLLQCFSYALESSWLVIYIPRSINLVDSSSPYIYSEALQTYLQPDIARNLLEKILAINGENLERLSVRDEAVLEGGSTIKANSSLAEAIQAGLKTSASPAATQQILELVIKTIVQQQDIPVLMAVDGAQALFSTSLYRDPDYRQLQSYELAVPRLLQSCLRKDGPGSFGGIKRGKVLTAFSLQHKEWPISMELKAGLQLEGVDAYAKMDEIMLSILRDCRFSMMEIASALTLEEAVSLADLAREEGGRWSSISDEYLMSKVLESGGSIGHFDRSLRKSTM